MAIDFGGVATTDNYSTGFVPKLNEIQKGLARLLDPATVSYTGTPFTGSFRFNSASGAFETFNGSSWVGQSINGISLASGIANVGDLQQANATYLKGKLAAGTVTRLFGLNGSNDLYIGGIDAAQGNTIFVRNGVELARFDPSGSVGIAGAPSTWTGGFVPIQIKASAIAAYNSGAGNIQTEINTNAYQSSIGAYNYIASYAALQYRQVLGSGHTWGHAVAGSAGAAITWISDLTIDQNGSVGVGGVPAPWAGGFVPVQIKASAIAAYNSGAGNMQTEINTNAYQSSLGNYNYVASYAALQYRQVLGGGHTFGHAAAGTAGGAITWTTDLTVTNDGRVYGSALHNNAGAVTGATNQYIASGTYTPTLTNVQNVGASIAYSIFWLRVGNVVSVWGQVAIDPTSASALTRLGISLPIASNFGASNDGAGCGSRITGGTPLSCGIFADATNDRMELSFICDADANNWVWQFNFGYVVI